ncbi:MAG: peptide chain release factor N(5)-glutamine methyltransferase [SAR202 cluster bacterium]|nr:peptide chain release factor N(5)-glutamine methyltransferase [SAR202 cluster bacterium]
MTVREAWVRSARRLEAAGVPDAGLEAEVLLRHALGVDRTIFLTLLTEPMPDSASAALEGYIDRRASMEPLSYITGHREFYGLDIYVTPAVLVPRPETELLVGHAIKHARDAPTATIVDACTGSGAIAVAIARNVPGCVLYATDISERALAVAEVNRRLHGVADRVCLYHGDLLTPVSGPVDVIVSNPPYLRTGAIDGLAPEVRREPREALDGGPDGLDIVRRLFEQASTRLKPGGMLICEIDPDQADAVAGMGRSAFPGAVVSVENDLAGLKRAVKVCLAPAQVGEVQ